ncbi:Undecaprenyl phosphate N,N'-diacetylbacillosamine 1-phosphate transferase [anaerobic digester metagenome]
MVLKRLFDIFASLFGLVVFMPLFILIALLIKIRMPGPVFFQQVRVGKDAVLFRMIKFRTMTVGHGGSTISVKGESRITPLGAILRKYKLDELPELWNILKGDMSFVGPRPDVPGYADKLEGENRLLLSIRPGLTGAASLKFSNEEEFLALQDDPVKYNDEVLYPEKVRINNNYVRHMSFGLDLKIIIFTILGKKLKEEYFN